MRERESEAQKRAKELRSRMPSAELVLWSRLRRQAIHGMHFRRQHPIGPYIADFACASLRLVVEVDGGTHGTSEERTYDARRDAYLRSRGWRVLRFQNWDVFKHLNEVMDVICRYAPPPARQCSRIGEPPPP